MDDLLFDALATGLFRTTSCTVVAALAATIVLQAWGGVSPATHRLTWALVLLQGCILFPATLKITAPEPRIPTAIRQVTGESLPKAGRRDSTRPTTSQHLPTLSWHKAVAAGWVGGGVLLLLCFVRQYRNLIHQIPCGTTPNRAEWLEEWEDATAELPPTCDVQLRLTDRLGPLLCYAYRAYMVLVPRHLWSRLAANERRAILRHEIAHLRRHDLWKHVAIRALALPQWFNPLAWYAVRRFEEAGEWACDQEAILASPSSNTSYATTLLQLAEWGASPPSGAVAASRGYLARRIRRILSSPDKEVSKMKSILAPILLLAIAATQGTRIETVHGYPDAVASNSDKRAAAVQRYQATAYKIEPPDLLSIDLQWKNFSGKSDTGARLNGTVRLHEDFLVGPDGKVEIYNGGEVFVAGLMVHEAEEAIAAAVSEQFGQPTVGVAVAEPNSKVVYVIRRRRSGDLFVRLNHRDVATAGEALRTASIPFEEVEEVYLLAPNGRESERFDIDPRLLSDATGNADDLDLLPGDRLFVIERGHQPPTADKAGVEVAPADAPPAYNAYQKRDAGEDLREVKMSIQLIADLDERMRSIRGLQRGDGTVVASEPTLTYIEELIRKKQVRVVTSPVIATTLLRAATVRIDGDRLTDLAITQDRLTVSVTPKGHAAGTIFSIEVCSEKGDQTAKLYADVGTTSGHTIVHRLGLFAGEGGDSVPVYLAVSVE